MSHDFSTKNSTYRKYELEENEENPSIPSIPYGLPYSARSIEAQIAETEVSRFFVGTLSLKEENEIHLIEVYEEDDDWDVACTAIFNHSKEIWSLSACPGDPNILSTVYNSVGEYSASLWKITDLDSPLEELTELKGHNGIIKKVLWNPKGDLNKVFTIDDFDLRLFDIEGSMSAKTQPTDSINTGNISKIMTGCWNPHHTDQIMLTTDKNIRGFDLRTKKESIHIENAHKEIIRDLNFNPNKPYYLVSGSDDTSIKFWDVRKQNESLKVLSSEHSHWIWNVNYNRSHDQLLISSSSDAYVNLWFMPSLSSGTVNEEDSNSPDLLVKTYEEHDESIYSVSWSSCNDWMFGSLSYDGRVVINFVPNEFSDITRY